MENDDRLIFLLGHARHRLMKSLDRALLENAGVTAAQSAALLFLMNNSGCLLRQLSRGLMLDNSAITGLVDRLEKKGLIDRRSSGSDRRASNIFLSDTGREAAEKALQVVKEYDNTIREDFSREEIMVFRRVLQSVMNKF